MPREFVVAVDLAQQVDYTAIACLERRVVARGEPAEAVALYELRHLERFLHRPYPWVVERVATVVAETHRAGGGWDRQGAGARWVEPAVDLVVDKTGVGAGVTDHMRAAGLDPVDVTITAGSTVNPAEHGWTVPKIDLATITQLVLQQGRLRFAAGLPDLEALKRELAGFRVKIAPLTGRVSFAAAEEWRAGTGGHDDLVLAVSLGCWWFEFQAGHGLRPLSPALQPYFGGMPPG